MTYSEGAAELQKVRAAMIKVSQDRQGLIPARGKREEYERLAQKKRKLQDQLHQFRYGEARRT